MANELPGTLIGTGRNADVYDIGGGRVLRRYRDISHARAIELQARVMAAARASGVPVPEVFEVTGSDIVMERAVGSDDAGSAGPPRRGPCARRPGCWPGCTRSSTRSRPPPGLPAPSLRRRDALLHRDLHPDKRDPHCGRPDDHRLGGRGPRTRDADVAMTWVIIAFSEVPENALAAAAVRGVQGHFTRSFVRAAGPLDQAWRTKAVGHRLLDPNVLPAEAPAWNACPTNLAHSVGALQATCRLRHRPETGPVGYAADTNRRGRWRR